MDFIDQLQALATRVSKVRDQLVTEEAAKTALVLPFIRALGYDFTDPTEVVPEYHADVPGIKGERVDYAIMQAGQPIIVFECKAVGEKWGDPHHTQLFRYFTCTPVRVGVLTNGILYEFYSDLDDRNKMDRKPFMVVDLANLDTAPLAELRRLTKGQYIESEVVVLAEDMKYNREFRRFLSDQFKEPGEEFARLLIAHVYSGKVITQKVRDKYMPIVRKALQQFVSDQVNDRLRAALSKESVEPERPAPIAGQPAPEAPPADADSAVQTTVEEMEAFYIVKAIVRDVIETTRISMRDQASYCSIIVDGSNRKPVCRLGFNSKKKSVSLFDTVDAGGKAIESKAAIAQLDDIYGLADRLRATVQRYGTDAK